MQVLHPRCAALDLGKDVLVAGVGLQKGAGVQRACRTYRTTRRHLLDLVVWLESLGITHVMMEATGSYWKSVWNLLEGRFELLRELTRTRKQFVRESARHTLRIQKLLDVAGLKITGPISEFLGVSGRRIVKALIAGETDPERLAALADPHLKASRAELVETLQGELTTQQRRLLEMHLKLIENLETAVAQIDRDIAKAVAPFRELVDRLKDVPGLSDISLRARRGANKAIVAVAASILTAVYCMIRDREPYRDLGFNYFQQLDPDRMVRRSVARLQQLGYVVTLTRGAA